MSKNKVKKTKKKGFTLIELLAVIVILAVVMGIAITSVLGSMNKARGGATFDTAKIIANSFKQRFTESQVDGAPSDIYKEYIADYNFTESGVYYINEALADAFSISPSSFSLSKSAVAKLKNTDLNNTTTVNASFVAFNAETGNFTVCLLVPTTSPNYVDNYKLSVEGSILPNVNIKFIGSKIQVNNGKYQVGGKRGSSADIEKIKVKMGTMMACSDGTQTWN